MRAHWCGAILLGTVSTLLAGPPGSARIGIYHWGGRFPHSVAAGVETITTLGGQVARITLSARYPRDYNIAPECHATFNLTSAAQDPDLRRALENPDVDVFLLTVYDGVTWGDCERLNFLDPAFFSAERTAAVVQEYSDFTLFLYRSSQSTHKRRPGSSGAPGCRSGHHSTSRQLQRHHCRGSRIFARSGRARGRSDQPHYLRCARVGRRIHHPLAVVRHRPAKPVRPL